MAVASPRPVDEIHLPTVGIGNHSTAATAYRLRLDDPGLASGSLDGPDDVPQFLDDKAQTLVHRR